MHNTPHPKIGSASSIPLPEGKPVLSISPIVIPIKGRPLPLEVRVTVPFEPSSSSSSSTPKTLPILLLSHGHGHSNYLSSLDGSAPLSEFFASHGFAVLQPTHLSSAYYAGNPLLPYEPGNELNYKSRPTDLSHLLDHLPVFESFLSPYSVKLDIDKIVCAGHSLGALTCSFLLGATNLDPRNPLGSPEFNTFDPRVKAGVLLASTGSAGPDHSLSYLSEFGKKNLVPFYDISFEKMTTPALVVYGDEDVSPHLVNEQRGADWHGDPYYLSPPSAGNKGKEGDKSLLILKGAKHGLGGVSGWDAGETLDESPERLEVVRRVSFVWLWSRLYEGEEESWAAVKKVLGEDEGLKKQAVLESK